jgi:predicted nucleotidyltransferase
VSLRRSYPTQEHEKAAEVVANYFSNIKEVESVLLIGSCARGKASPDSCLDMAVLVRPEESKVRIKDLEVAWNDFHDKEIAFKKLKEIGKYAFVEIEIIDGDFKPKMREWTSGPDDFELEIGNFLGYSVDLLSKGNYLEQLKAKWLPYYSEELREKRLNEARKYCINNLEHIPLYLERELYFQSFHRLYVSFREFLQALFISKRVYPISYDKWIREQVEEVLGLPELYVRLPRLFEYKNFESREIADRAKDLRVLLDKYAS